MFRHDGDPRELVIGALSQSLGESTSAGPTLDEVAVLLGRSQMHAVLCDLVEQSTGPIRLMAGVALIKIFGETKSARRAREVLGTLLDDESAEVRLMTAYWTFDLQLAVPPLIPALHRIQEELPADDNRRLWTAGAIFRAAQPLSEWNEVHAKALNTLLKALNSPDPYVVIMAAMGLEPEQIRQGESRAALLRVFPTAVPELQRAILVKLRAIGADDAEVRRLLFRVSEDREADSALRMTAITTLAGFPREIADVDCHLRRLLDDPSVGIARHVVSALLHRSTTDRKQVAATLLTWLERPDPQFRLLGAAALVDCRDELLEHAGRLLTCLEREADEDVQDALVRTLGSSGPGIIPLLERCIENSSFVRLPLYHYILLEIANQDVVAVAGLLKSEWQRTRQSIAGILQCMGPAAAPAVPVILEVLAQADSTVLMDGLMALSRMGPTGVAAAPRAAELLSHPDRNVRRWAEESLVGMGVVAVPALHREQLQSPGATEGVHRVLDRLLMVQGLGGPAASGPATGIDGVDSRSRLELFAVVAGILEARGPLSFDALEEEIESGKAAGTIPDAMAGGASHIRLVIRELEQRWTERTGKTVKLTSRRRNSKGGLTPEGTQYLARVRSFLNDMQGR